MMMRQAPILSPRHVANARVVHDRTALLPFFPKGGTIVEVGVALGNFSKLLIEVCQPKRFIAIDIFQIHRLEMLWGRRTSDIFAGKSHAEFYRSEIGRLAGACEVVVMEGDSADQLRLLADRSVDLFYVDADHTYEACSGELAIIKNKVKDNGLICLNDYILYDAEGTGGHYGVIQATNEFMIDEGWEMLFLALQQQMYCDVLIRKMADNP